jgi:hypothetical protein
VLVVWCKIKIIFSLYRKRLDEAVKGKSLPSSFLNNYNTSSHHLRKIKHTRFTLIEILRNLKNSPGILDLKNVLDEHLIGGRAYRDEYYMRTSGLSGLEQNILDALHRDSGRGFRFFGLDNGIFYNEQFKPYARMGAIFNATFHEAAEEKPSPEESPEDGNENDDGTQSI